MASDSSIVTKLLPLIREQLSKRAPDAYQAVDRRTGQSSSRTEAEILVEALFKLARNGEKFALELIFHSIDGKPASAEKQIDADTTVEDRLDDVSRSHLNRIAGVSRSQMATEPDEQLRANPQPAGGGEVG